MPELQRKSVILGLLRRRRDQLSVDYVLRGAQDDPAPQSTASFQGLACV